MSRVMGKVESMIDSLHNSINLKKELSRLLCQADSGCYDIDVKGRSSEVIVKGDCHYCSDEIWSACTYIHDSIYSLEKKLREELKKGEGDEDTK